MRFSPFLAFPEALAAQAAAKRKRETCQKTHGEQKLDGANSPYNLRLVGITGLKPI